MQCWSLYPPFFTAAQGKCNQNPNGIPGRFTRLSLSTQKTLAQKADSYIFHPEIFFYYKAPLTLPNFF
jgi:hypothetical protein